MEGVKNVFNPPKIQGIPLMKGDIRFSNSVK